jgi:hypothetical protein
MLVNYSSFLYNQINVLGCETHSMFFLFITIHVQIERVNVEIRDKLNRCRAPL